MLTSALIDSYGKLAPVERHVAHLFSLSDKTARERDLVALSKRCGWSDRKGRHVTQAIVKRAIKKLIRNGVLHGSLYGSVCINPEIADLVVQDSIEEDWFEILTSHLQDTEPRGFYSRYDPKCISRDVRVAFYNGDVDTFKSLVPDAADVVTPASMLCPFNRDLYDRLDPVLQEMYLVDAMPRLIGSGMGSGEAVEVFEQFIEARADLNPDLVACAIDVFVACGQLQSLVALDRRTNNKWMEIAGCHAMMRGDWEQAESCFAAAMPIGKRGSKKSKTATKYLPAVLYLLLLLKKNSADARRQASSLLGSIARARGPRYADVLEIFKPAISFQGSPSSPSHFAATLKKTCQTSLVTLLAGYLWNWTLTEEDTNLQLSGLQRTSKSYQRLGMSWLAAEAAGLAGKTSLKNAPKLADQCSATHERLGTRSLVDVVRPAPRWQRALHAIGRLAEGNPRVMGSEAAPEQQVIWEIGYRTSTSSIQLRPFVQKWNGRGWTKGRPVALERLYEQYEDPEFAFLSEQDLAICRTLEMETDRNYYGYTESTYYFDDLRVARALVGHPRLFREGDRENPVEIREQEPHLMVTKTQDKQIALSLNPELPRRTYNQGEYYCIREEGPHRLAFVFFNEKHHELHKILDGTLRVPESAADRVMESIEPVASMIAVHSEIGGNGMSGEAVSANPHPHLHLSPYHGGLQAKFFVRPFGDEGPFFVPGEGAETVVAKIADQPRTAHRDLNEERRRQSDVIAACSAIAMQADGDSICFPTMVEALETLLQLEELVVEEQVTLHWPRGRRFQLAGQASASQFRVNIRRDRDWFAASGDLKVDQSLSLDLMKLMELVEASPSRFVELDDGRFLALTEQLRQRIEELAVYGERGKHKLRFPPIRAAAFESLQETASVKTDKHWRECVKRMRDASEVTVAPPSTLSAELRDYQLEGFQWLARLAHWGAGACLADDMGLGKTIQALALMLHRSSGGPALVVAPTSVAFNWRNEIQRFAPTLNAQLFGSGDRDAALQDLGPRDVVICSYGLLCSEAERLQARQWHTIVLDEAQAIKNVATKRSRAAMGLEADFRFIMTGTPVENHLGELWNLFQFINPGLLGSPETFQQRFAVPIERDGCRETRRRLKNLIQPFILRRTKSQVLEELPSRTEITLKVELSEEEAAFYEALRRRALENLEKGDDERSRHLRILAELMRLRRACCHPRLVMEDCGISSSKLALFSETLAELLDNGHKVLVFSQFVDHLAVIREELDHQGISYQYLDGSTPAGQRKKRVEAFQAGEGDVFLISLKAGGLGLNLTAADYVIHMDPWWNPATEDQASDRAHRLGQQRPVTIYRLITQETIEERITALHATKRDLADSLLEGTDVTGKLSAEELLRLIRE